MKARNRTPQDTAPNSMPSRHAHDGDTQPRSWSSGAAMGNDAVAMMLGLKAEAPKAMSPAPTLPSESMEAGAFHAIGSAMSEVGHIGGQELPEPRGLLSWMHGQLSDSDTEPTAEDVFVSQVGSPRTNDCGPASVLMALRSLFWDDPRLGAFGGDLSSQEEVNAALDEVRNKMGVSAIDGQLASAGNEFTELIQAERVLDYFGADVTPFSSEGGDYFGVDTKAMRVEDVATILDDSSSCVAILSGQLGDNTWPSSYVGQGVSHIVEIFDCDIDQQQCTVNDPGSSGPISVSIEDLQAFADNDGGNKGWGLLACAPEIELELPPQESGLGLKSYGESILDNKSSRTPLP